MPVDTSRSQRQMFEKYATGWLAGGLPYKRVELLQVQRPQVSMLLR